MPPEAKKFYHERINNFTAVLLLGVTILCWGIMVLLSFTVVFELISWGIGALQDVFMSLWLFLLGVYSGKRNKTRKILATILPGLILLIPFLNDFPAEVLEMGFLIFVVRLEDRENAKEKAAAEKQAAIAQAKQAESDEAARAAQLRAQQQREQAMRASLATVANDNSAQVSARAA